jgi:IS5 family transposase
MDLGHIFRYVSEAKPTASHDIERMREVLPEIEANLDENDKIVLDKGYVGLEKDVTKGIWLIKKKTQRDYPLKEEDIKFNQKIEKVRRHIEFGFGDLKSFFDILVVQFRYKRE